MKCQCKIAGYCATHRRMMREGQVRLCREERGYFEAYQKDLKHRGATARGAGDTLKTAIESIGAQKLAEVFTKITGKDCGCSGRQQAFNKWFKYREQITVVVTTAPRQENYLPHTLASLVSNHWEPIIFAEPGSNLDLVGQLKVIQNSERLGAWRNWVQACRYAIDQKSPYILTMQDDTTVADGTAKFLESFEWPADDCGMVSLYTPPKYIRNRDHGACNRIITSSLWGACAMLFRREELIRLLDTDVAKNWNGAPFRTRTRPREPWEVANVDTAVGKMCRQAGMFPYFFNPSLAEHIGVESSIGHKGYGVNRKAGNMVGDWSVFDHE